MTANIGRTAEQEEFCAKHIPMKRILLLAAFGFMNLPLVFAENPDSLGLPGDHLSLCGVLELFKKAKSPEDFEKSLNSKNNKINNLDLNEDKQVDYIRVVDLMKGDAHAIVLQVAVNAKESQDVAVIQVEKKGQESAQLQIIGDKELYGANYILEPKEEKKTDEGTGEGKWENNFAQTYVYYNVWYWPCVQYVWYPTYVVWVSPWYWMYWPSWWIPWSPYPWYMYYGWVQPYYGYYYWSDEYRLPDANNVYAPRRTVSPQVEKRYEPEQKRYEARAKTKPGGKIETAPAPSRTDVTPAPKPSGDAKPQPSPQPKPSGDVKPQPSPQPKPPVEVRPQQPRPQPQPQPKPPRQPTPRKPR